LSLLQKNDVVPRADRSVGVPRARRDLLWVFVRAVQDHSDFVSAVVKVLWKGDESAANVRTASVQFAFLVTDTCKYEWRH
jgi:hypothetical protein